MKKLFCLSLLLGVNLLSHPVQPWTTPQQEEEIILEAGKTTHQPLSEALSHLIKGISDQTFNQEFFSRIKKLEKEQYTGEYTEKWENGQLKIQVQFKNGKVDGHVHGWFDDGIEAFKAFFYENKKAGIHIAFYPVGLPRRQSGGIARLLCYDMEGKLDYHQEASHYDGRLKLIMRYVSGIREGKSGMYDAEGKCLKKEEYRDGKLVNNN